MSNVSVAAYYFGNYHVDPRNVAAHGAGWTEWNLVRQARPRFPGHAQPKVPLWGYEDESDPVAAARKIDAAADHGLSAFIFDWYHYNDGLFLERALEQGFLRAANNRRLKFALMWANHDWVDIHPAKYGKPPRLLYPGAVTRATFDRVQDYCIATYFRHPSYWTVDGKPYFSVYELFRLVEGLGGVEATRDALDRFRGACRAAGLPGLHLNAVVWGVQILPGEKTVSNPNELLARLGFDSVTSYCWVHHVPFRTFPTVEYDAVAAEAAAHWQRAAGEYALPYFPNVSMGWDASARTVQSDAFENIGYPFMPLMANNTPAAFGRALQAARRFIEARPGPRILTINAWNEWTEGSYLEPDTIHGLGYLEALRDAFE